MSEFEYIEFVRKVPLWRSIPQDLQVTEEMIRAKYGNGTGYIEGVAEAHIRTWLHGQCDVAVKANEFSGFWRRCSWPIAQGADRCAQHGGPRIGHDPEKLHGRIADLKSQIVRLQAKIDGVS